MAKKITQNVNKDVGLLDLPNVNVPSNQWNGKFANYFSSNIGDIVPIYVDEVLPKEKRRITMGMLSHMTTPKAPLLSAQYTEFRAFFVPHRLSADLLNGYTTRKSPWVKVFGEDNATSSANVIVPLANQTLPSVSINLESDYSSHFKAFGGLADALDCEYDTSDGLDLFPEMNFLSHAAYEIIYQYKYRNQNRESATNSNLYKWLCGLYSRTSVGGINYDDAFHTAQREKDYFTGSSPFTQKSTTPVTAPLSGMADVKFLKSNNTTASIVSSTNSSGVVAMSAPSALSQAGGAIIADLTSASGVDIEQLRLMIKTQELLEKDMMYGSDYMSSLNAHFGTSPISLVLEEPLELKKVTITSHMQPIFQTSSTTGEPSILGQIGANATTQSDEFEIVPLTKFEEYGYLIICAVHKSQNLYDSFRYKPKHIFKKSRFDFYTPELNDLGFQPVQAREFYFDGNSGDLPEDARSYNEAWAEYRYKFNRVHGMLEPSRANALDYWSLAISNYSDIQSLYKQDIQELNRAIAVTSAVAPQFFDAFGFIEYNDKPMSLHSIPGMDGVI